MAGIGSLRKCGSTLRRSALGEEDISFDIENIHQVIKIVTVHPTAGKSAVRLGLPQPPMST